MKFVASHHEMADLESLDLLVHQLLVLAHPGGQVMLVDHLRR